MTKLNELFEPELQFELLEESGSVDGQHILGRLKGQFFVPNGVSRNNRYYPKELWERVVADSGIRKRMVERRMYGTVSHDQDINDKAILEGKISHVVTNLQIEGDRGIGEALILATPAGQILNTMLRAGCKLFVSSRANGAFKGEQNGIPVVDPNTYQLIGFDIVIDPGFMQANPDLVESLDAIHSHTIGDNTMGADALLESIAKENGGLKVQLESAVKEVEVMKNENTVLTSQVKQLKERLAKAEALAKLVEKYKPLGTPEEVSKALDLAEKKLEEYKPLGTPKEIDRALTASKKVFERYRPLGTPEEISEALDRSRALVETYLPLGKPSEISKAFDVMEKKVATVVEQRNKSRISTLAKELNVSEDKVRKVYGKISEKEIRELFKDVKVTEANAGKPFVKTNRTQTVNETNSNKTPAFTDKSRGTRLMESLSR